MRPAVGCRGDLQQRPSGRLADRATDEKEVEASMPSSPTVIPPTPLLQPVRGEGLLELCGLPLEGP